MMEERRQFLRAPLSLMVKYKGQEDIMAEAFTGIIGGGGLFIETFNPLPMNREITMELHLPGKIEKTVIEGKVVWNRQSFAGEFAPGMGIKFTKVSKKDQAEISELVTRILVGGTEEGP